MAFHVTTSEKTPKHPFFKKGWPVGYLVNGVEGATLCLEKGKTYSFDLTGTPGHPFYVSTQPKGGPGAPDKSPETPPGTPGDDGVVNFTPKTNGTFYYACGNHPFMGGQIDVKDSCGRPPATTSFGSARKAGRARLIRKGGSEIKEGENLESLGEGFESPIISAVTPAYPNFLFIGEQKGIIKILDLKASKVLKERFLDITSYTSQLKLDLDYDERGLLGFVFHPQFGKEGKNKNRVFIYYSVAPEVIEGKKGKGKLDNYGCLAELSVREEESKDETKRSLKPVPKTDIKTETVLLRVEQPEANHNGGTLAFGPDGMLYLGLGDGGGQGDKHGEIGNAQNLKSFHGKILRFDVDIQPGRITAPKDNPFPRLGESKKDDATPFVWAYGLRNPWNFSFDKKGRLWVADAGQDKREEVDLITKGGNYGWRAFEGSLINDPVLAARKDADYIFPLYEYDHLPGGVVIGGRYHDSTQQFIFADLIGKVFSLKEKQEAGKSPRWVFRTLLTSPEGDFIKAIGLDSQGSILLLTSRELGLKGKTGKILRLDLSTFV